MKISLIYVSHRPGGFDVLGEWLSAQNRTAVPIELVVVDGFPMRVRGGKVVPFLADYGVRVNWYGEPKLRTFPHTTIGYANAVNTGLMHATGSHFVVVHDFMVPDVDSLEAWAAAFAKGNTALTCGDRSWHDSGVNEIGWDDCLTWEVMNLKPVDYVKSDGFQLGYWGGPIELMEDCNGIDERTDFCHGWAMDDLKVKAEALEWELRRDPAVRYKAIVHHSWGCGPLLDPHTIYRSMPIADIPYNLMWTSWSANPFVLKEERNKHA